MADGAGPVAQAQGAKRPARLDDGIEDFGRKRAMLTLGLRMGRPDIGLVATEADYRGRGMAGDLVRASLIWAINRDHREAQVVTQAENAGACRFYEALGYRVEREDWVYHFWL